MRYLVSGIREGRVQGVAVVEDEEQLKHCVNIAFRDIFPVLIRVEPLGEGRVYSSLADFVENHKS